MRVMGRLLLTLSLGMQAARFRQDAADGLYPSPTNA